MTFNLSAAEMSIILRFTLVFGAMLAAMFLSAGFMLGYLLGRRAENKSWRTFWSVSGLRSK